MNDDPIVIEGEISVFENDSVLKESGATEPRKVIAFEHDGQRYEIRMRVPAAEQVAMHLTPLASLSH
jgi:hypothetical protein